jgi:hypothetical protein
MSGLHRMAKGAAVVAVLGGLTLAGCGDDSGSGDVVAFCDLNDTLNAADGTPTSDQLDDVVAAAPSEIKDDARTLADALKEQGDDLFTEEPSEELIEAIDALDEFTTTNCTEADSE